MIGTRLKALRTQRGETQAQTAQAIGISRTTYANYERNYREPDFDTLVKLAYHFDVSSDYLLGIIDVPLHISAGRDADGNAYTFESMVRMSSAEAAGVVGALHDMGKRITQHPQETDEAFAARVLAQLGIGKTDKATHDRLYQTLHAMLDDALCPPSPDDKGAI
nr:helix-turn-helix transcriptional regulator [Maliibacterium massiliense]